MKVDHSNKSRYPTSTVAGAVALAVGLLAWTSALAIQPRTVLPAAQTGNDNDSSTTAANADSAQQPDNADTNSEKIVIEKIEPMAEDEHVPRKRVAWLGVSTEEASEALNSQLGLEPGAGLVVTYVAANSPAAQAGLKKNDVLVEFEGQLLVHPSQLRKLVRARKEGDQVKLTYYRAGKKESMTVTLGKTAAEFGSLQDQNDWQDQLKELKIQLHNLPIKEAIHEQMKSMHESLSKMKIDEKKVQEEVHRGMAEAQKALREALRHTSDGADVAKQVLEELAHSGIAVGDDATVTVRSNSKAVSSIVKADDSGTIVLVANPKLHLTAHDKKGKLVFDGEIETTEQRDKVPRELWERVQPLVEKLESKTSQDPKAEEEN
jgi:membrane-associated protease RseP (regulator of RpoE activity)